MTEEFEIGDPVYLPGFGPTRIKSKRKSGFTDESVYSLRGIPKVPGPGEVYSGSMLRRMTEADYKESRRKANQRKKERDSGGSFVW